MYMDMLDGTSHLIFSSPNSFIYNLAHSQRRTRKEQSFRTSTLEASSGGLVYLLIDPHTINKYCNLCV